MRVKHAVLLLLVGMRALTHATTSHACMHADAYRSSTLCNFADNLAVISCVYVSGCASDTLGHIDAVHAAARLAGAGRPLAGVHPQILSVQCRCGIFNVSLSDPAVTFIELDGGKHLTCLAATDSCVCPTSRMHRLPSC